MKKTKEELLWNWLKKYQIKTDKFGEVINADARSVFEYVMKNFEPKK